MTKSRRALTRSPRGSSPSRLRASHLAGAFCAAQMLQPLAGLFTAFVVARRLLQSDLRALDVLLAVFRHSDAHPSFAGAFQAALLQSFVERFLGFLPTFVIAIHRAQLEPVFALVRHARQL